MTSEALPQTDEACRRGRACPVPQQGPWHPISGEDKPRPYDAFANLEGDQARAGQADEIRLRLVFCSHAQLP